MYIVLYLPKYILCCVFINFIFAPLLINKSVMSVYGMYNCFFVND